MAFFNGDTRQKKTVSLRGASKEVSKDVLLRAAAKERQERELIVKQIANASRIQKWFRQLRARASLMNSVRTKLDAQLAAPSLNLGLAQSVCRRLFLCFRHPTDTARLLRASTLLQSTASTDPTFLSSLGVPTARRFLHTLLRDASRSCTAQHVDLIVSLLAALSAGDPGLGQWLVADCLPYITPVLASPACTPTAATALLSHLLRSESPEAAHAIATQLLCGSSAALILPRLTGPIVPFLFAGLAASSHRLKALSLSAAEQLGLITVRLYRESAERSDRSLLLALLQIVTVLLGTLGAAAVVRAPADSDDEERYENPAHSLREALVAILQPALISSCVQLLVERGPEHALVTSFFARILESRTSDAARDAVLAGLSLRSDFLPGCWRGLTSRGALSLELVASSVDVADALLVFAEAFGLALLTLDDNELLDKFPAAELSIMSRFLAELSAALCPPQSHPVSESLRACVLRLLRRLHGRDVRMHFTEPGVWLVAEDKAEILPRLTAEIISDALENDAANIEQATLPSAGRAHLVHVCRMLHHMPFAFPFDKRALLFRQLLESMQPNEFLERLRVRIRRDRLYEDAFEQLAPLGSQLRRRVRVAFVDDHGLDEAGIDGGGLWREFLTDAVRATFNPDLGLFTSTPDNSLYPSAQAAAIHENYLEHLHFAGLLMGKALFDGILLDVPFANFFLLKLLAERPDFNDLQSLDPELYRSMLLVKNYPGNVEDLCLTFAATEERLGLMHQIDLVPNGSQVAVTDRNKLLYVFHMANYRLNGRLKRHMDAFCSGLFQIIPAVWLRLFAVDELQMLISGENTHIDVDDMRKHTVYGGEFRPDHHSIVLFWRVVRTFDDTQLRALVKFVTGTARPPLLGFRYMRPQICVASAGSEPRLPTASTCMNLLKLPVYTDEEQMREKLLMAITSGTGFHFS